MRIVVTGAEGMLGQALGRLMGSGEVEYRPYYLSTLDVTDRRGVEEALSRENPDWVIHAAAYTQVDDCESDPERAFTVNVEGARHVADAASAVGARVLYLSTDYVFDGGKGSPYNEDDEPAPLNVYGESKLGGERAVQDALPADRWVIVRTAWLYGEGGPNFVENILGQAEAGRPLTVVDDQIGNPTWTVELARAIQVIIEAQVAGIYHVVSGGLASWFELAKEILRLTGTEAPLEAIKTEALEQSARRPAYSVLDTTKFQRDTGVTLEAWQGALALYLVGRRLVAGRS